MCWDVPCFLISGIPLYGNLCPGWFIVFVEFKISARPLGGFARVSGCFEIWPVTLGEIWPVPFLVLVIPPVFSRPFPGGLLVPLLWDVLSQHVFFPVNFLLD